MEKVRPWCGQPSDRGRLKNRTEQKIYSTLFCLRFFVFFCHTTKHMTHSRSWLRPRVTFSTEGRHISVPLTTVRHLFIVVYVYHE